MNIFPFWHEDEKAVYVVNFLPVSLSDAVGQPCEIKAKKEQIKSHVYIYTTVTQHLSTYSSSKVQGN